MKDKKIRLSEKKFRSHMSQTLFKSFSLLMNMDIIYKNIN
jgi:hypothetical protein